MKRKYLICTALITTLLGMAGSVFAADEPEVSRDDVLGALEEANRPPINLFPIRFRRWNCTDRSGIIFSPQDFVRGRVNFAPDSTLLNQMEAHHPELMAWPFWFPAANVGITFVEKKNSHWPKDVLNASYDLGIEMGGEYAWPKELQHVLEGAVGGSLIAPVPGDKYVIRFKSDTPAFRTAFNFESHSYQCQIGKPYYRLP